MKPKAPKANPGYFTPASFRFLRGLARHNERAWFLAHKGDYETRVRAPFLRLIADLDEPLRGISPHFVADPRLQGGSLFRIYRDVRFSHDKRPYKEWASAKFFHERTRELAGDAPCFYLHLQPGNCFLGGGIWHPQKEAVKRIRAYLLNNPSSWKAATQASTFRRHFELSGEALKRPPQGYDPEHELIDDLKRKDFIAHTMLADDDLLRADLPRLVIRKFRALAPMNDWLCGALDLDF